MEIFEYTKGAECRRIGETRRIKLGAHELLDPIPGARELGAATEQKRHWMKAVGVYDHAGSWTDGGCSACFARWMSQLKDHA